MSILESTRISYTAGLPTITGTVTLFNSVTAFPPGGSFHLLGQQWFQYSLRTASAAGTATGTVTGSYSTDKGVTWIPFYSKATADAVAASAATVADVFTDSVYVGVYKDIRFQYTNAVEVLTVFDPLLSLHSKKPKSKVNDSAVLSGSNPITATAGAVSSWFRVAEGTVTGSGYSSIPDRLNLSSPMTQSTDALRPPASTSANGLPILAVTAHVMDMPLIAARTNTATWGMWGWIKRNTSANNLSSIGTSSGSSAIRTYTEIIGGNNMRVEVFSAGAATVRNCDAAIGALNTWQFFTIEYNSAFSGDARFTRTLGGAVVTTTFSGTAASVPSALNAATGSGTFGAFTLAGAFPFIGSIGPNYGFLGSAMVGVTEGLLTPQARLALMAFEAPT